MTSLIPKLPLSQVVFVHDYVQLRFQHEVFNLCGPMTIRNGNEVLNRLSLGFCDRLVALIEKRATRVTPKDDGGLDIHFGVDFIISIENDGGPEPWVMLGI